MEAFLVENAHYAHWVIFGLFMLAGLSFPISEDLLIIISGALASTIVPENTWKLFSAVFLGAYLSDLIVYLMGLKLGTNLIKIPWFARIFKPRRLEQIQNYYKKYGMMTLIIGRFIPFGVRNCLFVTAGIGKMRFWKFLFSDGIACFLSNTTLFTLSYFCGKNFSNLLKFVNIIVFSVFLVAVVGLILYKKRRSASKVIEDTTLIDE